MRECWKDIEGYEDLYMVSNTGKVKRKESSVSCRNGFTRISKGRVLKNLTTKQGYANVVLSRKSKTKRISVHRLVALAFIPNPENKPFVNHIDGNKLNNHVSNLEWCTPMENTIHAVETGLLVYDNHDNGNVKLSFDNVTDVVRKIEEGMHRIDIAKIYNVDKRTIYSIYSGKAWINHPYTYDMRKEYPRKHRYNKEN